MQTAASSRPALGPGMDRLTTHEAEQQGFGLKRETLVCALDSTSTLVSALQAFNQEKWTIRYPHQLGLSTTTTRSSSSTPRPSSPTPKGAQRATLRRSSSLSTEESSETESDSGAVLRPALPQRAYSTNESPVRAVTQSTPPHPLSILSLDLKLGHPTAPTATLPALLPSLSLATLSQLLSRRLTSSLTHLTALRARVLDTSSKILVTGDLNAGKSTLVNALLRRDVMPSDQQPCTTVFCEVLDAESYNDGVEEIHAIKDVERYDVSDRGTFDAFGLERVNEVQDDEAGRGYQLLKAYVTDSRSPVVNEQKQLEEDNPSFIKNGLVSISLIDAPGLNRDTLSTTALFARQAEIDVIVFVVSAENHFTLSAKEFLWNASREKAYVFIVVNKWKGIKDKERCMRVVGEQIKQLSPATWSSRHELVHFVDAAEVLEEEPDAVGIDTAFDHLEQSLRSFVLLKRTKSKLTPAKHYLLNLLADLSTLSDSNVLAANAELREALRQLELVKPTHERLVAQRDEVEEGVDKVEENAVELVRSATWGRLESALGHVVEGRVVPPETTSREFHAGVESIETPVELPVYPGLFGVWTWAEEVKRTLVKSLEAQVRAAEDDARSETVDGVKKVLTGLGDKYLPGTMVDGLEQHERVFRPEVMFAKRRRGVGRLAARGISTGLGLGSAGLGTAWTASEFEVTLLDLFNLERIYTSSSAKKALTAPEDEGGELAAVSVVSVGVAALGMFGSRVIGIKGAVEAVASVLDILGSQAARKWAGPVVGIFSIGLAVYIIIDLPNAIPLNIGRKLVLSLSPAPLPISSLSLNPVLPTSFATAHSDRISRETRKVLRLAGWDLRERFRAALEKSAAERREVEGRAGKANDALGWLGDFLEKVRLEEVRVDAVELQLGFLPRFTLSPNRILNMSAAFVVPKVGKAAYCVNPGPNFSIELRHDYPVPTPGRGDLLIKMNATGLCLSDIHFMKGDWGVPMDEGVHCAGHEGAGTVVAMGADVDPLVWKVGDRAGIKPILTVCQECRFCRSGQETVCDKARYAGAHGNGSYAEYALSPAHYTSRIPEGVSDELAGPIMCSGATVYTALKRTGAKAGEWVGLPGGGGGVGSMGIQYGKAMGLRIVVIDTGDEKKEMCLKLGAEAFVDFMTCKDVPAEVKRITGEGCQGVVVTGGTAAAYSSAPALLRKCGVQVCVGLPAAGTAMAGADPVLLCFYKLSILGSLVGGQEDVDEALDFAARGLIKPKITILPFAQLPEGVARLAKSQVAGRLVVDFNL